MEATALSALGALLDALSIRWVLIGALAANRYRGSPRLTQDIDILIENVGSGLPQLEAALVAAGWNVRRADSGGELLRLRHASFGIADLLVAGTDYQIQAIDRAHPEQIASNASVRLLTVEDVIVHKLIAGRAQDLADIEAILAARREFDRVYIERWAQFWDVADLWARLQTNEAP